MIPIGNAGYHAMLSASKDKVEIRMLQWTFDDPPVLAPTDKFVGLMQSEVDDLKQKLPEVQTMVDRVSEFKLLLCSV